MQCHLEFTEERTRFLIEKYREDLQESIYAQAPETILTSNFYSINNLLLKFLEIFVAFERSEVVPRFARSDI
ncbi:hypothetical protein [Coxiella-like endosymbiont of Rhipicephalus sanguineus]|uniref:hypothetical protein n=1 Tax=Coxiella-like endosymbiont of Rhipicephalus sanguineus TaxID=1955402 RepID=UPI00203D8B1F|nr:hypothetical protein [Coxiella-like endosymbiont of Rhipicephalus sanguineus]